MGAIIGWQKHWVKGVDEVRNPADMTIAEAAVEIAGGRLTAATLAEACIARTEESEADVRAWAYFDADKVRMAARLADTRKPVGPLHAIPFGVKDIIETADMPTGYGTPIYHDHSGSRDAACVALLKEAGAVAFGKAVTTELAHFHPGKTRNPHAATRTPGGSSSGSAAAVAAGMVPCALGTQTTGSVLRPASYCGVFGFKPSYGDVMRSGVFECAVSFDTVGWFTRSIEDVEIVRRALLRAPPTPLPRRDIAGLRVGFFRSPDWAKAEPGTQDLIESAAAKFAGAGATVADVAAPEWFSSIGEWHRVIAGYEFARAITFERVERSGLLSAKLVEGRCGDGLAATYDAFAEAQRHLAVARRELATLTEPYDVLLTPSAPGEAWDGLAATGDPVFNLAWTALHVPCLSVPAFKGAAGLPIGLQLVGRYREDAALLSAAAALSQSLEIDIRPVPAR